MSTFVLTSDAFEAGKPIPPEYTCDGADRSPALHWSDGPDGTASFALLVVDPDAPRGDFTHWVLFDLPGSTRDLPAGAPASVGTPGTNDFGKLGYCGPCPPRGHGPHRYVFTLYALDRETLGLGKGSLRSEVERALRGHSLGQGQLIGTYERR